MLNVADRAKIKRFLVYKKGYSSEEAEKTVDLLEEVSGVLVGMWSKELLKHS